MSAPLAPAPVAKKPVLQVQPMARNFRSKPQEHCQEGVGETSNKAKRIVDKA